MNTKLKLFVMMVLQFFIWGAWLPPLFGIMPGLNFDGTQQALIGSCFAIASIVGIFFSNQWADRAFAAEKFLAVSHLIGGGALVGLWFATDFWTFFTLMLIHSLVYVPTISITNSIAFAALKDPQKEFGVIRMGGTVGWIAASWPLYFILGDLQGDALLEGQRMVFLLAGIAALLLAGFSMTLPHTPPKAARGEGEKLAWAKAASFLKKPFIAVLFVVTFLDATIHDGYFVMTYPYLADIGFDQGYIMPVMSLGQIAEVATMAALGLVLKRLGWRATMIIGVLGHAARFAVFAYCDSHTVIVLAQLLHGICYAFFFATVYIFIDVYFPKDVRTSAQGLFNLLILGLGSLAAKWIFVPLRDHLYTTDGEVDYSGLFLWPTGMALAAAVILAVAFHPPKAEK